MNVLITGDPVNGFSLIGPFFGDDALAYADRELEGEAWVIAPVIPRDPDPRDESFEPSYGHDRSDDPISEYEAERWRAMSDELSGQITRISQMAKTRPQWQAIEA